MLSPIPMVLVVAASIAAPLPAQDAAGALELGIAATEARDPAAALEYFERALAAAPANAEAAWRASIAAIDVGRLHEAAGATRLRDSLFAVAEAFASRGVESDSGSADGWFALGNALGRTALSKSARQRVRLGTRVREAALRAIELDPQHDGAHHVLGRWNAEVMRLSGISRFFARRFLGARVFDEASWEAAIEHLARAAELDPTYIYHRLDLAEVLVERKRWEEARRELEAIPALPDRDIEDGLHRRRAAQLLEAIARRR